MSDHVAEGSASDEATSRAARSGATQSEAISTVEAVTPQPNEEELAAIVAAIELAWPNPVTVASFDAEPPRWRFAGRWWTKPVLLRRERPW
jgi:hypothetical protein